MQQFLFQLVDHENMATQVCCVLSCESWNKAEQKGCILIIPRPRHNSCRKGVCRNASFPNGCLHVSYGSWDKSKNTCPCENCTFPNSVHRQNLESTRSVAFCFPGHDDAPHWEICNSHMCMGSCYINQPSEQDWERMSRLTIRPWSWGWAWGRRGWWGYRQVACCSAVLSCSPHSIQTSCWSNSHRTTLYTPYSPANTHTY